MVILYSDDWFICPRNVPIGRVVVDCEDAGYYQDDILEHEFKGARYRLERTPSHTLELLIGGVEYQWRIQ